jgi:hypothetical protein
MTVKQQQILPDNVTFTPIDSACNLGIILDKNLSFSQRISSYSKSCFLNIRDLPVTQYS